LTFGDLSVTLLRLGLRIQVSDASVRQLGLLAGIFVKPITGSYPGVLSGYLVNRCSPGTLPVFRVTGYLSCSDPDDRKCERLLPYCSLYMAGDALSHAHYRTINKQPNLRLPMLAELIRVGYMSQVKFRPRKDIVVIMYLLLTTENSRTNILCKTVNDLAEHDNIHQTHNGQR